MTDLRDLLDAASKSPDGTSLDPHAVVHAGRRRVRRRGLVRGGAALALVVAVSATTLVVRPWDSGPEGGVEPFSPVQPVPAPTPETNVDPDHTPPGTQLAIGQTALVPIKHVRRGEAELTVTGVRRADRDDIIGVLDAGLRERAERGEFWYVDVTLTYVSGRIGGYFLDPDVKSVTTSGRQISQWTMGFDYAPCTPKGLPRPAEPGDSVEDCLVFQSSAGAAVVGLQWGSYRSPYEIRRGDPVIWR